MCPFDEWPMDYIKLNVVDYVICNFLEKLDELYKNGDGLKKIGIFDKVVESFIVENIPDMSPLQYYNNEKRHYQNIATSVETTTKEKGRKEQK